LYSAFWIDK